MILSNKSSDITMSEFFPTEVFGLLNSDHGLGLLIKPFKNIAQDYQVIEEFIYNGLDSHRELKLNKPVDVTIKKDKVTITDFGTGLDINDISEYYCKFFSTNRSESNEYNGIFGLGSKKALSVLNSFEMHTIKNGQEYHWLFKLNENIPTAKLISQKPTDKESGTKIIFSDSREYYIDRIKIYCKSLQDLGVPIILNGTKPPSQYKENGFKYLTNSERNGVVYVQMLDRIYTMSTSLNQFIHKPIIASSRGTHKEYNYNVLINIDNGSLEIDSNNTVIDSTSNRQKLESIKNEIYENYKNSYIKSAVAAIALKKDIYDYPDDIKKEMIKLNHPVKYIYGYRDLGLDVNPNCWDNDVLKISWLNWRDVKKDENYACPHVAVTEQLYNDTVNKLKKLNINYIEYNKEIPTGIYGYKNETECKYAKPGTGRCDRHILTLIDGKINGFDFNENSNARVNYGINVSKALASKINKNNNETIKDKVFEYISNSNELYISSDITKDTKKLIETHFKLEKPILSLNNFMIKTNILDAVSLIKEYYPYIQIKNADDLLNKLKIDEPLALYTLN